LKHNLVTFIALTALVLSSVIFWETGFVEFVLIGIAIAYLACTAYGSYNIEANYFIDSLNIGKTKGVALTFDDGPDPETTPAILAILKAANVKATFFVIGKKAALYPDLLRQIDDEGHAVANHSYSHSFGIGFFSTKRLSGDIAKCNEAIRAVIGKTPVLFRPPFGVTNPRYKTALKDNGMTSVGWSLRSLDTQAKNKYQIIDKVMSKLKRKDIVLLHDNIPVTVAALEDIIEHCKNKRLHLEPLSKVINKDPYAKI
jgi:peptidoglycan/xylan/chitin deacetylase (PgdA/CDA1 family)